MSKLKSLNSKDLSSSMHKQKVREDYLTYGLDISQLTKKKDNKNKALEINFWPSVLLTKTVKNK